MKFKAVLGIGGVSTLLLAAPQGESVVHGAAQFQRDGALTKIEALHNTIINYSSFDVQPHETVQFVLPSQTSRVLNRVTGKEASQILGTLTSNGQIYIVNPQGVFFGKKAIVSAAKLYTIAGHLTDHDFLQGIDRFTQLKGQIVNEGTIEAGSVFLAGEKISNSGVIVAKNDIVAISSGSDLFIAEKNSKVYVKVAQIENSGTLESEEGLVLLQSGDIYTLGRIRAKKVALEASGKIAVSGSIDTSDAEIGGTVQLLGDQVRLLGAAINASGGSGGGEVLVGGDYQGQGLSQGLSKNATLTVMDEASIIVADAINQGNGGKVILWSDDTTLFDGQIFARGGTAFGDGGFVETSGKIQLGVTKGFVDTRAPYGLVGNWLLDPDSVTIQTGGVDSLASAENCAAGAGVVVDPSAINAAVSTVTLCSTTGSGTIIVNNAINMTNNVALNFSASTLVTINADVTVNGNISFGSSALQLQGTVTANNSGRIDISAASSVNLIGDTTLIATLPKASGNGILPNTITGNNHTLTLQTESMVFGVGKTMNNLTALTITCTNAGLTGQYNNFNTTTVAGPINITADNVFGNAAYTTTAGDITLVTNEVSNYGALNSSNDIFITSNAAGNSIINGVITTSGNCNLFGNEVDVNTNTNISGNLNVQCSLFVPFTATINAGTITSSSSSAWKMFATVVPAAGGLTISQAVTLVGNSIFTTGSAPLNLQSVMGNFNLTFNCGSANVSGGIDLSGVTGSDGSTLTVNASGSVSIGNSITTAGGSANAGSNAQNGGNINITSSGGGISVPSINTSGSSVITAGFNGGNGGSVTLQPSEALTTGISASDIRPAFTVALGGNINAANGNGFGGGTAGTPGDVSISTAGRASFPSVATITGSTNVTVTCGNFTVGTNEIFTVLGSASLSGTGTITVGEFNCSGNQTVSGAAINLILHAAAMSLTPYNQLIANPGLHYAAGGTLSYSTAPGLTGSGINPVFYRGTSNPAGEAALAAFTINSTTLSNSGLLSGSVVLDMFVNMFNAAVVAKTSNTVVTQTQSVTVQTTATIPTSNPILEPVIVLYNLASQLSELTNLGYIFNGLRNVGGVFARYVNEAPGVILQNGSYLFVPPPRGLSSTGDERRLGSNLGLRPFSGFLPIPLNK